MLGLAGIDACPAFDSRPDGKVTIDELISAVGNAVHGCVVVASPTPTQTPAPGRFTDNGDGTVTDTETGLMWEQKTTDPGLGVNLDDPHDVDNTYTWNLGTMDVTKPDGTVFTDFLGALNGGTSSGNVTTGCFAGHCDWRLPTFEELVTILLASDTCDAEPCIDPAFGPTQSNYYWSASTYINIPFYPVRDSAWSLAFNDRGDSSIFLKTDSAYVRAVRGGCD